MGGFLLVWTIRSNLFNLEELTKNSLENAYFFGNITLDLSMNFRYTINTQIFSFLEHMEK